MPSDAILNPQERLDWLRLIRTENVGPVTFHQLLQRHGSAAAALAALPELARRGGRRNFTVFSREQAERELAAVHRLDARLVAWGEPDYPPALAPLDDAPPLLTVLGRGDLTHRRSIALVGARNASAAGQRFAREMAYDLARAGFVVTSGLARGIDAAAHGGALAHGTVAVVGGGADVVYPEENRGLYEEIVERGAVMAESPVGTVPQARHFPRRNRLISGMSDGVVVIEAALRSGSLITARFAAEQGREVFAVPGSPLDPRCRGTNDLIRHGATLVEGAEDVLTALAALSGRDAIPPVPRRVPPRPQPPRPPPETSPAEIEAAEKSVTGLLGPTPVTVDELLRQCHLSPSIIATVLLELELAGRLDRHPGGLVSLR
ncbi:DNA processing protein DprA [Aliidongia dinghuensis]|uniref:DNA processing protein DprA n=1 Tax=Aliidongia dinghuensis TaxID=1867774 RepID=A0A8J2YZB1_9PROT|nr:DNA-processing protein DprA [Aliidongia dinghuensis]GGF36675.1 DNA processing protein DprA [Aliidongia dinghuensis]